MDFYSPRSGRPYGETSSHGMNIGPMGFRSSGTGLPHGKTLCHGMNTVICVCPQFFIPMGFYSSGSAKQNLHWACGHYFRGYMCLLTIFHSHGFSFPWVWKWTNLSKDYEKRKKNNGEIQSNRSLEITIESNFAKICMDPFFFEKPFCPFLWLRWS